MNNSLRHHAFASAVLALAFFSSGFSGCPAAVPEAAPEREPPCTLMACSHFATFDLAGVVGEGADRVVVEADGARFDCPWGLPLAENQKWQPCAAASPGRGQGPSEVESADIDPEAGSLWLHGAPERVRLVIFEGEERVFEGRFEPAYETIYPNGEACDRRWGGCRQASVEVGD